jgi:hypothetical protein
MYDGLERELTAGSGNKAPRVSGSREAPIPGRLDVLNLRGPGSTHPRGHCDDQIGATPVFAALETWERDWRDLRGWAVTGTWPDLRTALGAIVRFLDAHLDWAADEHPAFDEFAAEVRAVHAAMRVAREGREPVVVVGPCPAIVDGVRCGSMLRMLARADVVKCRACGQSWEWEHFPSLATAIDQAERKSA